MTDQPTARERIIPLAIVMALLIGAYLFGAASSRGAVRIVYRTVTRTIYRAAPAQDPTTRHDQAGVIAADQAYVARQDAQARHGGIPAWTLGYIVSSVTPSSARVINWVMSIDTTSHQPVYSAMTMRFRWTGQRWVVVIAPVPIQPLGHTPVADADKFQPFPGPGA